MKYTTHQQRLSSPEQRNPKQCDTTHGKYNQEEVKVSVVTRSGAGEQYQSSAEIEVAQDEDIEVKEEPLTRQQPIPVYTTGRSMALGGYIAPTIDWAQDSQLPGWKILSENA